MISERDAYIIGAARTPFGAYFGSLKTVSAPELGASAIKNLIRKSGVAKEEIKSVVMGHVLTAGTGQHPARQAALLAGIPNSVPAKNVNKVCASSLFALKVAAHEIWLGDVDIAVAGGMENMTRAPFLVERWCKERLGTITRNTLFEALSDSGAVSQCGFSDHMVADGLTHPYLLNDHAPNMAELADLCAREYCISREMQEEYAYASTMRALDAAQRKKFAPDPVFIVCEQHRGFLEKDETLRPAVLGKMRILPPLREGGSVTAATSSKIADGAAALLLARKVPSMGSSFSDAIARVCTFAEYSHDAKEYPTAPVGAIKKILSKTGLKMNEVDLFEINEAFAVVPLFAISALTIPKEKVNVWGGSITFGHPIGASGARIVGNLALQLREYDKRYGIAVACNGGGEATAVLLENAKYSSL